MENGADKITVRQAVVVEGRYDKAKLSSIIDGMIITTDGFRIYKDKEKAQLLRAVALKQGVIVITDSDHAGFQLRGYLRSILQGADITHVYVPQVEGKEKRKRHAGKEGLLGVEGIAADTLRKLIGEAVLQAQKKSFSSADEADEIKRRRITKQDFFEDGLSGGENSLKKRQELLKKLGLPLYITANALLEVVNSLLTYEEYKALL